MAAMIAGFEVDFVWLLQAVMHERAFTVTTTYPFEVSIDHIGSSSIDGGNDSRV